MKVLIVNAFDRGNRGDAALLSVAIRQIREAWPHAEVTVSAFEDPAERPEFDGVPNIGSIRRYVGVEDVPRPRLVVRKALALGLGALAALPGGPAVVRAVARLLPGEMRTEIRELAAADLVVSVGGGHLRGKDDFASDLSIAFLLLPQWLAQRFRVPVVLAPQSFGPFPRRVQKAMVRRVLGGARTVTAREDISLDRLAETGLAPANLIRGKDSAFAFDSASHRDWRTELGIPPDARLLLVTAREWLARPQQDRYEAGMAAAIRRTLEDANSHVVLVPQVTCAFQNDDDRIINRRIAALADDPRLHVLEDDTVDHHDVFALYRSADLILGTRFHSVIFGLVAGVPCAAVEYDHKTRGIMADLGLDDWVVAMEDAAPDTLVPLLDRLAAGADAYRKRLRDIIPGYVADAAAFTGVLRAGARTVAIVTAYYPPKVGGVENYTARIARAAAATGDLRPVVITTRPGVRTVVTEQDGVRVIRLGAWLKLSNTPLSPLWPLQLRYWLRRTGAELVNAHAPVPGLADLAAALPGRLRTSVLTYHAGSMRKNAPGSGTADRITGLYERHVLPRVFARAGALVAVSEGSLAARLPGAVQLTPGVDLDRFTPGPPPSRRPRTLLYAGRLDSTSPWKGVDRLLRAFARLADVPGLRLKLVGGGDALPGLLRLAGELGVADRVDAVGELAGEELVAALREAAVLALPSLTEAESFGLVLVEAMACGTPVVATEVGGVPYTVGHGEAGLLVPPDDPDALAAACRELLLDGDFADRMGAAGRRRAVERYDWNAITDRWLELLRTLPAR
ncbi:D-inositol-3-phosphate glycosyltransferase [Streptomyces sp. RB5]|uniref:D-inositol-3-phosphate glycosyltransferase n=1 Tax=Streptomyces smaragdinus TaxID=2585196 RepID=A0A7K0CH82_9ACTN|nr:glycosyltransferase [Streptomyces smaragdinus]MQY12766.1 D-inositol-3-phosphate glycosyltransferase [Streptomyces smaragdinus]